jgi:hypothetical protein
MSPSRRVALASTAGAALALAQHAGTSLPVPSNSYDAVSEWVRRAAIPLATPLPGRGFDDMVALKQMVGDARIVALGEASHGAREFFELKHRMLEFLVTQMGFSIFSLEANMAESSRLNDFVLRGEGDPAQLLKGPLTMWDTQEVLNMVLWMREYNRSGKGRVEFTGFDMQTPPSPSRSSAISWRRRMRTTHPPGRGVGPPERAGRAAVRAVGGQPDQAPGGHGDARCEHGGQCEVDSRSIEGRQAGAIGAQFSRHDGASLSEPDGSG